MDQTKTCPFCATEIKAEAAICHFCGSDLSLSPSKKQPDSRPKKKGALRGLKVVGYLMAAFLLVYLSRFLPEGAKAWYDWFFGRGKPFLDAPVKILVVLYLVIGCLLLLKYRKK